MWYGVCFVFMGFLLSALIYWARQDGKKAERLSAIKREIQGVARVQSVKNKVDNLPMDVICKRLQERRKN